MTSKIPKVGDIIISAKEHEEVYGYHAIYEVFNTDDYYQRNLITLLFIVPEDSCGETIRVTRAYYEAHLINIS